MRSGLRGSENTSPPAADCALTLVRPRDALLVEGVARTCVLQVRGSSQPEPQTSKAELHCNTVDSCFLSKDFRALRRAERRSAQGQRRWPLHVWSRLRRPALIKQSSKTHLSVPRCAPPACDVLVGLAGRQQRVWNPRSRAEHQREPKDSL